MDFLGTPQHPTFGLDTFGDVSVRPDGTPQSHPEALEELLAEGVLADEVGVDEIGVGEHHRADFAVSAPDVVLAAIAGATTRIRLNTAVTVLSSEDPVRVFQRFATLDGLSGGRAEITLGRGSFTESFPLFGLSLADYDVLFAEKLDLFVRLLDEGPVTWEGTTRAGLIDADLYPKTASGRLPTWIGIGGTPQSVVRAARYGLPLVMAVIGGSPARFAPYAELYHDSLRQYGHQPLPIAMHCPGHIAATDEQAIAEHQPAHREVFARIGRERGWSPMSTADYLTMTGPEGAYFVGSPETVARKIAWAMQTVGLSRFQLKYAVGGLPHAARLESIRHYGQEVIPRVRELLASGEMVSPSEG